MTTTITTQSEPTGIRPIEWHTTEPPKDGFHFYGLVETGEIYSFVFNEDLERYVIIDGNLEDWSEDIVAWLSEEEMNVDYYIARYIKK